MKIRYQRHDGLSFFGTPVWIASLEGKFLGYVYQGPAGWYMCPEGQTSPPPMEEGSLISLEDIRDIDLSTAVSSDVDVVVYALRFNAPSRNVAGKWLALREATPSRSELKSSPRLTADDYYHAPKRTKS